MPFGSASGRGRSARWTLVVALHFLAAAVGLLPSPAVAQTRTSRPVPPELLQKAWDEGPVRVVVELGGGRAEPEHHLAGPRAVAAQRGRIAADRATSSRRPGSARSGQAGRAGSTGADPSGPARSAVAGPSGPAVAGCGSRRRGQRLATNRGTSSRSRATTR